VVVKPDDDDDRLSGLAPDDAVRVHRVIKLRALGPRSMWSRARCGFDSRFIGHYGHFVADEDKLTILRDLLRYDLVWIHQIRTADVFGQWRWPRSVMDIDDIPSTYLRTERHAGNGLAERLRAGIRLRVATRRERFFDSRFTTLSVCSDADRTYLGALGLEHRIHVIPNGFARPPRDPLRQPASPPRVGFIGTFEYAPNVECVRWFVEKCWPLIKECVPDARLRLVGSGSDGPATPRGRDIEALGWARDAAEEIDTWSVMVVPLQTGAGTRVKIAEGFSRKCPIVSTTLGAHGYAGKDGEALCVADSAEDFASACVRVLSEPARAAAMAERAWRQFIEKWTWEAIQPRVWEAAEDCLRAGTTRTRPLASPEVADSAK
jgi:glycosyltransferase involved in cell wall biosynthesis